MKVPASPQYVKALKKKTRKPRDKKQQGKSSYISDVYAKSKQSLRLLCDNSNIDGRIELIKL